MDVERGTVLSSGMLELSSYPSRFAPPGALHDVDTAVGRTLLAGLATGEPLTRTRLSAARAGPVASLVPAGMRGFTIASSLPSGSVRPGDHVDVLATFAGGQPHTETVATGVEILTVLSGLSGPSSSALGDPGGLGQSDAEEATLVLLVRPDQVEELAYARAFADLSLAVEGPDEEVSATA
jgi:Flp pilus assembly protein CpaB